MEKINIKFSEAFLNSVINDSDLHRRDFRILFLLFKLSDKNNFIEISQKRISLLLDIEKTSISKSLSRLEASGLIEKVKDRKEEFDFKKGILLLLN
ncbi:MAG: MarR family transcriptional regulator [Clostridium perfringens]